ncbi:MAG: hypothetical protein KC420_06690 [Myxococcales bacterium]|nr:hypothetical protein [Myxococcales bacterium]MCB9569508.1 hypothetical protein [Myxococcales bacterium]MCB9706270.1 hypothetical protein [Myxococcales bacterium]
MSSIDPPRRRLHARLVVVAAATLALACSKRQKEAPPEPPSESAGTAEAGATLENPVPRCGALDSYRWIAREFRCSDGSNPFHGDARAAARARAGSTGSPSSSHILDIYRVPCPEGPRTVYVDMYACPYESVPDGQTTGALDQALALLEAGDFGGFVSTCGEMIQSDDVSSTDKTYCMVFSPVGIALAGDLEGALEYTTRLCDALPPPSAESTARADFLQMIFVAFTSALQVHVGALSQADVDAYADASANACGVPRGALPAIDASGASSGD